VSRSRGKGVDLEINKYKKVFEDIFALFLFLKLCAIFCSVRNGSEVLLYAKLFGVGLLFMAFPNSMFGEKKKNIAAESSVNVLEGERKRIMKRRYV
jgi:hypothetical protein